MGMDISGKEALYNLFAELCDYVVRSQSKNYLVKYSCISPEEKQRIEEKILNHSPLTMDTRGNFALMNPEDIDYRYMADLYQFAAHITTEDDNNCIMRLLQALDQSMASILSDEIKLLQEMEKTKALNTNRIATGIELLPRCECVWARKSRQSFSYRRLDNYLKHFMVIEDRAIGEIEDQHIFLPKGFFKEFDKTGKLKVAASPLTANSNFDIRFHRNEDLQVFSLDYHKDEMARDNQLVWDKIITAGSNGAEVVVFPEMLGNETMEEDIQERLSKLDESMREWVPALIVLPSYFHDGQNSSAILDRYGHELSKQFKQNPYVMKCKHGEYMENIFGANLVTIFHYEGIGRFAVLICKDFLTTRYMERIMRGFMLTMIIVPAYSTGSYDFKMSFDLCAHDYCNVVWINSCAAMTPGKESNFEYIGYVRKRINRFQDESEALYKMKPCTRLFTGKCDRTCLYFDSFGEV